MLETTRRKKILRAMNDLPSKRTLRLYEWIDSRSPPKDDPEPDGEFKSFNEWVNKAVSWIGYTGAKCFDAKDRPCYNGGDFSRARDENAFPVRWYLPDRFPEPKKVPIAVIVALAFLVKQKGAVSLKTLREEKGAGNITPQRIQSFLYEGEIKIENKDNKLDSLLRLTDEGKIHAQDILRRHERTKYIY